MKKKTIIITPPTNGTVVICAWCDHNKKETDKFTAKGIKVSHGICKSCFEDMKTAGEF